MYKVFIDAGHGGSDPGATNGNNYEKNITLTISKKIRDILKRHNIEVIMSRENDKTLNLSERTTKANNSGCNILVSIHCNSFSNSNAKGFEIYHYPTGTNGKRLSTFIYNNIIKDGLYTINRGIKSENFHVLREFNNAATLIEVAFISNSEDLKLLLNKQDELSISISKGILDFFNIKYEEIKETNPVKNNLYYRVITGSFKNKQNALDKQQTLKSKGEDSFINAFNKNGEVFYRVIAGSFQNKQNALDKQSQLKKKGFDSFIEIYS